MNHQYAKRRTLPKTWEAPHTHLEELLSNPWFRLLAKLHGVVQRESTLFFNEKEIYALMLPVTTGTISSPMGLGSDSMPVAVELFDRQVYLADSMQFLLELGVRLRPDAQGVWYIMPSFRGELPDSRHLNEFIHLEAEIRGELDDVINLVDSLISRLSQSIISKLADDVKNIAGTLEHLESAASDMRPRRLRYSEAVQILDGDSRYVVMHEAGFPDITPWGERKLLQYLGGPVWLTHHPVLRAPFYQKEDPETGTALCADLLLGIGEVVGSGARQMTADAVTASLRRREVDPKPYKWYVEMKRLSPLQTAGFGMGLERFFAWVCKVTDIRHMQLVIRQRDVFAMP